MPVKPQLGRRLKRHVDKVRQRTNDDHLWITNRRSAKTGGYVALERRTVQAMLKSLAEAAAIDAGRVHPHGFRHSLTTELLRKGVNPIKVAELLGHRSLAMLMAHYSHVRADDIREDLDRLLVD